MVPRLDDWSINPEYGDTYTFVALDPSSKLVIAYLVGTRDLPTPIRLTSMPRNGLSERQYLLSEETRRRMAG